MQDRDLGPLGETEFKRLCHTAGLTVHKSEMDRTGWDFLVEFPCKQNNRFPQDLLLAPLECKIQVKSTDKKRKRGSITLSNLDRLVKAPMPVFFCFIEFDGEDMAQAVYLVHVGKEIIEKTLKRIRELENEGQGNNLNKHTLDITYGDADKLESLTGRSLKSAIEKIAPDGMIKYIENKNHLLNTLGFEDGKYQAKITIMSPDPIGDILDVTLGIRKEIDIYQFISYHKRFEILSSNPNMLHDGGVLSIYGKPKEARLTFKEHGRPLGISFAAKLHISPLTQFLPRERLKFRVESRFFELIIESDKINCSIHPYSNDKVSIKELTNFLELLSIFEKTSKSITVELKSESGDSNLSFSLNSKDLPSSLFEIKTCGDQIFTWSAIADMARKVIELCRKLYISEEDLLVQIEDLLSLYQYTDLGLLYQALCGSAESVVVSFPDGVDGYQQDAKAASVGFAEARIGNYVIGCCLAIVGSLSLLGDQQMLVAERFLVGQQFIRTDNMSQVKEQIEGGLNELVEELQNEELAAIAILNDS
ncbi:hypothetical protein NUACC21_55380 [Scytonema sp. NUACC21]